MPTRDAYRWTAVAGLAATTAANAAFLWTDPRLFKLPLWLSAAFLAGGAAYVLAIPLCLARRGEGFVVAALLGVAGFAVAAADDLGLSGSAPNAATFSVNLAVMGLQVPLVLASVLWLRRGPAAA